MASVTPKHATYTPTYFALLAKYCSGIAGFIADMIRMRRTQHDLRALSDRELDDIGLTRDQIEDPAEWPPHRLSRRGW